MTEFGDNTPGRVAVIGFSLRVPGAGHEHQFWRNLSAGTESISLFSDDELDPRQQGLRNNPDYVRRGGVLADIDRFDAEFFACSAREAQLIDPQQRQFLQACWEALENAGYETETYAGLIGIYAGAGINTYLCLNVLPNADLADFASLQSIITANDKDYLCSRIAYKLNLRGPAVVVQTACSTSLVAVHLACQSLLSGECDMALAGGVSIRVPQRSGYVYQEGGILSPDGHCRPFDAQSCGTVPTNGLGVVVVKRLEDALADGDHIRAVILGSAINNDGSRKVGFMAPSIDGQASVIAEAQAVAGVTSDSIGYIEAHGTGTELGDPIEIRALSKIFAQSSQRADRCALGSVKGNLGHLDTAAGVVGLIKCVLCLEHRMLPPTVNFHQPNPKLDLARTPFYLSNTIQPWRRDDRPLRAGVSSFGIGGTNAHVVLEEAPEVHEDGTSSGDSLLLLSARTPEALERITENLRSYLEEHSDLPLRDVAYTLQVGRRSFAHRRMFVARNRSDLMGLFASRDPARVLDALVERKNRPLSFLLPDHGVGDVDRAGAWYRSVQPFRKAMDDCAQLFHPHLGLDLNDLLRPQSSGGTALDNRAEATAAISAGALFSVEYAMARALIEWGLQPEAMLGVGVGEYVAGCIAKVLPLEMAVAAITDRDRAHRLNRAAVTRPDQGQLRQPEIPFISGATGTWITNAQATDPCYWFEHDGRPAFLDRAVKTLLDDANTQPLDLGPGPGFCESFRERTNQAWCVTPIPLFREMDAQAGDSEFPWGALGQLWLNGVGINWAVIQSARRRRVPLPTYPFEGRSYWIAPPANLAPGSADVAPLVPIDAPRATRARAYSAPNSETEVQLVRIWEEVLGCTPIGINDDFFDLGGDSLAALQIATRIRRIFPGDIPVQKLAGASKIAQLAELIDAVAQRPSPRNTGLGAIVGTSPLVTLQTGKADLPFFCVHPAGGTVLCYVPLARRLGPEQTFYGLQAPSLYGGDEPSSIEEKADLFIRLIRQTQPRGPYLIGGHSYGGNLALEIASQLIRASEDVALLALLDSYPPEAYRELPSAERFREAFPRFVGSYLGVDTAYYAEAPSILAQVGILYPELTPDAIEQIFNVWLGHFRALQEYQPRSTYPGQITYYCCESDAVGGMVDLGARNLLGSRRAEAWSRLSSVPLDIHFVPGDHFSLLRVPYVDTLAALLRQSIERSVLHSDRAKAVVTGYSNPNR